MIKEIFSGMFKLYKWVIIILVVIFFISMLLGIVLPFDLKLPLLELIGDKFEGIIDGASSDLELTGSIFKNNLFVAVIAFILGFTVTLPLFIMVSNGLIMGIVFNLLFRSDALAPGIFIDSIITIIPHGIFELTAFFLAAALSTMVTMKIVLNKKVEPEKTRVRVLYESVIRFFVLVVPLLMVAAFVEVYISNNVGVLIGNWIYRDSYTEDLKVEMNAEFLANHKCFIETTNYAEKYNSQTLRESLSATAKVVYDNEIYEKINYRKTLPYWQQEYYCEEGLTLSVHSWPTDQWPLEEAAHLQKLMYEKSNTSFTESSSNFNQLLVDIEGNNITTEFTTQANLTVALTWNTNATDLAQKILSRE